MILSILTIDIINFNLLVVGLATQHGLSTIMRLIGGRAGYPARLVHHGMNNILLVIGLATQHGPSTIIRIIVVLAGYPARPDHRPWYE